MKGAADYSQWVAFLRMPNPPTQSDTGMPNSVPVVHFYAWAAYEPVGSREFPASYKRNAESTARFRIPYNGITIDPALHTIQMIFDDTASPPAISTWNILGVWPSHGERFEITIEANIVE